MHRVLKVALQPWPTLAGMKSLIEFGLHDQLRDTYFRADQFCKYFHDDLVRKKAIRQMALDRADEQGDGPIFPIVEMDKFFYQRPTPRTIAELIYGLVSYSSSSLSRSALETLPASSSGVVLRSRFSVRNLHFPEWNPPQALLDTQEQVLSCDFGGNMHLAIIVEHLRWPFSTATDVASWLWAGRVPGTTRPVPVCPWDGSWFVRGTIVPQGPSEKC